MKLILTAVSMLVVLMILGAVPSMIFGSSAQHTANHVLVLAPNGDLTNKSQPLLVKNSGSTIALYYIYDAVSGENSEVFAVLPNSTQTIVTIFAPEGSRQLIAHDFTTNLPISNILNYSVLSQTISRIEITPTSEHCFHYGNCLEFLRVDIVTPKGPAYSGILVDNRGDSVKIVNSTGVLQVGGGFGETFAVYINASGTRSNSLLVTL